MHINIVNINVVVIIVGQFMSLHLQEHKNISLINQYSLLCHLNMGTIDCPVHTRQGRGAICIQLKTGRRRKQGFSSKWLIRSVTKAGPISDK